MLSLQSGERTSDKMNLVLLSAAEQVVPPGQAFGSLRHRFSGCVAVANDVVLVGKASARLLKRSECRGELP